MRRAAGIGLAASLLVTTVVFGIGALHKAPCATAAWVEERGGVSFLCDTDIPHLYAWEQLAGGRRPYLDACAPAERSCDEYPAPLMYTMWAVASVAEGRDDPYQAFYWGTVAILLACALATSWSLERLGARTLLFAAAPVLVVTGTLSLDLIPVAIAALATYAFLRNRTAIAGALIGLGAAAKLFPGLLLVPFGLERHEQGEDRGAMKMAVLAASVAVAWNVPFAALGTEGWWTFFSFNSRRPPDYDTLWYLACRIACPPVPVVNVASVLLAGVGALVAWRAARRRAPQLPAWILAFPLLVLFVLTAKVWSSQYSLWLLPWFAFTRVRTLTFVQYQTAEVLEYFVRYHFFGTVISGEGMPYAFLGVVVVIRAVLLIRCLLEWVRDPTPTLEERLVREPLVQRS